VEQRRLKLAFRRLKESTGISTGRVYKVKTRALQKKPMEQTTSGVKKVGALSLTLLGYSSVNSIAMVYSPPSQGVPSFPGTEHSHFIKSVWPSGPLLGLA
jgi:hypothetical protein